MALDETTVREIASLARLHITDAEMEKYRSDLSNILDLVAQMENHDTSGIKPMTHPLDAVLRFRTDEVTENDQRSKFQALAPNSENGLYLVPKVID
ncbi:MAG: Asp-tRNA(Asn)/Glu-tRNA(Gln) amidotransferase subunit GatC [Arenicella sp.]|nr:Asp-tRNA(Asn)/Glu-tRNA(Gln) amidotransferase subunit GatC [Arenicella sp.]